MNDKRKKEFAATIKHLSEEIGKKPEVILENILRKVLLKTPIPALQKMGIVSGEPDEDIDVEASKKNVAEEIAADLAAEATCGRMRRVSFMFNAVLDYRLARGLGADFSTPFLWRKKDARQFLLQLLVMRKELAKIAKRGRTRHTRPLASHRLVTSWLTFMSRRSTRRLRHLTENTTDSRRRT